MNKIIIIAGVLMMTSTFANPTVYPTKPGILDKVITSDQVKSTFIMDTKVETAFYVLPPKKAYAYASGISVANTNLGFCEDIYNIQVANHVVSEKLKNITTEQAALQPSIDSAASKWDYAQSQLDTYIESNDIASQMNAIDLSMFTNTERLDIVYEKLNKCTSNAERSTYSDEIQNLQHANLQLLHTKQLLMNKNINVASKITQLKSSALSNKAAYDRMLLKSEALTTNKIKLMKVLTDTYAIYAKLEGGTAFLEFQSDWDKQVALLRSLNPGKTFNTINTHNTKINMALLGKSGEPSEYQSSAILDSVVNGRINTNQTIDVGTYPEQFVANVRLSLAGACPVAFPEKFHYDGIESGKLKLGASVSYQFDSAFNTKIDCTYDEQEMFLRVLTSGSSGWLFWKHNWENVNIDNIKSTTFSCNWNEALPNAMTFQERRKFEVDALNYAISRMLVKYGKPQDVIANLPPKPTSGLSEVGESLWSLCGSTNIYCAATSWVFQSFDDIFSGGQSTGSTTNHNQSTVHLVWDESLMYPVDAQSNFNSDSN